MKMKKNTKKYLLSVCGSLLMLALLIVWLVSGLDSTKKASDANQLASIENSIIKSAVVCYSIEGMYPADIDYLTEHYGVRVDTNNYIVHYEYFGGNIMPTVTVIRK